ncbi:MAG: NAD-dependent deacylase [Cytophagaceae bacterium]|nr:NAD-dependent deacylase [Cytophagaceae bacterium]MDW8455430.1 NAD-dependent deacylase [Cytophagaceae bacterium]
MKKHVVVLSGAGVSAESGLATFRDFGGLWEGYRVDDVATPEAWEKNPSLVLDFYNMRRKAALEAKPNLAHLLIAEMEKKYQVSVVTQNVDNLHERAGSTEVIHLHGELFKSRSTVDERLIYDIEGWQLNLGDLCEKGSQLRPHVVWFGEPVPMFNHAVNIAMQADIFIVVGTSLQVYPAASLIECVPQHAPKYIIDPRRPAVRFHENLTFIEKTATQGMSELKEILGF